MYSSSRYNWSWFFIISLKVTFPSHVHAVWSCANSHIKYEYLPSVAAVTVFCSANCVPYLMLSAKAPEVIFSNYLWFVILLSSWLLQKLSLQPLPTRRTSSSFTREKTFKTISTLLLTLDHYSCFPTQSVPSTSYSTQSFPSLWDYSLGITDIVEAKARTLLHNSAFAHILHQPQPPTYPFLHSTQVTLHYSIHCTSAGVGIRFYQKKVQASNSSFKNQLYSMLWIIW